MRTIMVDKIWYPVSNVISHFETDFADISAPKKAQEMKAVAVAMVGMQELQRKQYWIQGVSDSEQSPDVRTMCCDPVEGDKAPWCHQQDVEVVTYTKHSTKKTLIEFVVSTKLSENSSYDELTTVLVNVETEVKFPSQKEWSQALTATGKNNPVLVLGRVKRDIPEFRLAFVHPVFEGFADYNLLTLLSKQGHSKVMEWSLGTRAKETVDDSKKHCPFEQFGVKCRLLK